LKEELMKPRLLLAVALTGLIGVGAMTGAQFAIAQQSPPAAEAPKADAPKEHKFSDADRAAFREARIAALHAGLALTPDQEKLWPNVETSLRDLLRLVAEQRAKRHAAWREREHEDKSKIDPIAKLKERSENLLARGTALKKLADASAPLYASLTDEQKNRLHILVHALRPHHHHHHWRQWAERGEEGMRHGWWNDRDHAHGWRHHDRDGEDDR
jgi:zinc resistance-associated protein